MGVPRAYWSLSMPTQQWRIWTLPTKKSPPQLKGSIPSYSLSDDLSSINYTLDEKNTACFSLKMAKRWCWNITGNVMLAS
jgi:hypothetical protein